MRTVARWIEQHPARAGTVGGWYQQATSAAMALIAVPLIIKDLDASAAGLWFSFQAILAAVNLTDFGLSYVISRQVAYSLTATADQGTAPADFIVTRPGWAGVSEVYAAGRRMFRWVTLIGILVLAVLYHWVLPLGKLLTTATTETAFAWYLLGAATLMSLQAKPHQALLDGLAKLYLTRFVAGTYQFVAGMGAVVVLLLGGQLVPMAATVCVASVLNYGAVRLLVHWQVGTRLSAGDRPTAGLCRRFVRVAVPMGVLNLSSFCVSSVQVPLLGLLLGPKIVPAFYLAQRIGQVLNQGVMQLIFPQLPLFTQHLAAGQPQVARHRMKRTIGWVTGLAALANATFYFGSPWFVLLWVGPGKYVSSAVLAWMAVDYFLLAAAVVWAQFVLAGGENPFVAATVLSGILNLLLLFLWIPALGMVGIPLASLLAGLAINYWFVPLRGIRLLSRLAPKQSAGC